MKTIIIQNKSGLRWLDMVQFLLNANSQKTNTGMVNSNWTSQQAKLKSTITAYGAQSKDADMWKIFLAGVVLIIVLVMIDEFLEAYDEYMKDEDDV